MLQDSRYQCVWCETTFAHLGSANRHHNERRCRTRPREASPAATSRKRRRSESGEVRGRYWHADVIFEEFREAPIGHSPYFMDSLNLVLPLYSPPNNLPFFLV